MSEVRRIDKGEKKGFFKKHGKKIIFAAAGIGLVVGGYKAVEHAYANGIVDAKLLMDKQQYKNVKADVLERHTEQMFHNIFDKNQKFTITDDMNRTIWAVGQNQKSDFLEFLLRQPGMVDHAKKLIAARAQ